MGNLSVVLSGWPTERGVMKAKRSLWASHFWLSTQIFIFPQRNFFGFGWVDGLAWELGPLDHSPPG